jgi:glycosyltransferase involved in cell wall biosynthesis
VEEEVSFRYVPFLDERTWKLLYRPGRVPAKVAGILRGYVRRLSLLWELRSSDYVFIHREASPLGPPVFEWFIAKVLRKKIIYDFDDAIWLPNTSVQNRWAARLKWHDKVRWICKWAYKVSCGNAYLADYARQYNPNVRVLPTVVDTEGTHYPRQKAPSTSVTIGWTGSHSTLPYLQPLIPILQQLEREFDMEFIVIANQQPEFALSGLRYVPWNKETEIEDLAQIDIGLMPLPDDQWAKGKCGFKAIQYQAIGIPAVASRVGVNADIILDGESGFLADTPEEWLGALRTLIGNKALRQEMGGKGRQHIQANYSVSATRQQFLQLFS